MFEYIKQLQIALFGSPDFTSGNRAEINRRIKILQTESVSNPYKLKRRRKRSKLRIPKQSIAANVWQAITTVSK